METKRIIQRNLPLNVKYQLIDKTYIPLVDSIGTCCDNCNKLIANIATVKNEAGKVYNIGLDCLETFLLNNKLLDGASEADFLHYKKNFKSYLRVAKIIMDSMHNNETKNFVALKFDVTDFKDWLKYSHGENSRSYITFYYINKAGRECNEAIKILDRTNIEDFLKVIKSITKLDIITI